MDLTGIEPAILGDRPRIPSHRQAHNARNNCESFSHQCLQSQNIFC